MDVRNHKESKYKYCENDQWNEGVKERTGPQTAETILG